jgi:hypothetical protein
MPMQHALMIWAFGVVSVSVTRTWWEAIVLSFTGTLVLSLLWSMQS